MPGNNNLLTEGNFGFRVLHKIEAVLKYICKFLVDTSNPKNNFCTALYLMH